MEVRAEAAESTPIRPGREPARARPRVVALLGPDNAGDAIATAIAGAPGRLDVAVYEVGPGYAGQLATAARDKRVRLLLDAHNAGGANPATLARLAGTAVAVRRLGARGAEAHWKLILAGADTLLVGSGNLIARDAPRHAAGATAPLAGTREWWLMVSGARALVAQARRALNAAWARAAGPADVAAEGAAAGPDRGVAPPVGIPLPQVAPLTAEVALAGLRLATDAPTCAALLASHLAAARRRLLVTVPYVHPRAPAVAPLLACLRTAAAAGLDVRLLLGSVPDDPAAATPSELRRLGFAVRVMDPLRSTTGHAKGLVADETVVAGSCNWSQGGLHGNLEAALAVADAAVAAPFTAAFERDWEASG
ncbi:MAG TPA: phospholipase D-like domain-containing protein [Candidatus Dormibacteraeota bacterium]